jgi:hypothetical protein
VKTIIATVQNGWEFLPTGDGRVLVVPLGDGKEEREAHSLGQTVRLKETSPGVFSAPWTDPIHGER